MQILASVVSTVVMIVVAILMVLPAVGPPAVVAFVLLQQKKRHRHDLEITSFVSLLNFLWHIGEMIDSRLKCINVLKAQLLNSKQELELRMAQVAKLVFHTKGLEKDLKKVQKMLRSQQITSDRRLDKITQERDSSAQALDYFRIREKDFDDALHELHVTIKQRGDQITQREEEFSAKQEDALAILASLERERDQAKEQKVELEERLDAQEKSGQEATEKLEGELRLARDHIEGLMATIRSNSSELQMYRTRAQAQRQAAIVGYNPIYQAPGPFIPAPMGRQHAPSPFAPRPTQIPGFPPNRTSGFIGNSPPPGLGEGVGKSGGSGGGLERGLGRGFGA